MRRIKVFLLTIISAAACFGALLSFAALQRRLLFDGGESYRFYVGNSSLDCREVYACSEFAPLVRLTLREVNGESCIYKTLDLAAFLQKTGAQIQFTEELSDSINYYCTANLPYAVTLYGKEINLHICVRADETIVASPIIFGGY